MGINWNFVKPWAKTIAKRSQARNSALNMCLIHVIMFECQPHPKVVERPHTEGGSCHKKTAKVVGR